jgi:hypothetical protein
MAAACAQMTQGACAHLIGLALVDAGEALGLGRWWRRAGLVRSLPVLK